MRGAAANAGRSLMEGLMYRFHPRMIELRASASGVRFLQSSFAFPLSDPG